MFCDKRLKSIAGCCSKDHAMAELMNVRFHDGKAVATNGYILAMTDFSEQPEFDVSPPVESDGQPFSVSAESIMKAFKNLPKKARAPHEDGIFVAKNVAASFSDAKNSAAYADDAIQDYPPFERVIPDESPDDTVVAFSKANLLTLISVIPDTANGEITFHIPPNGKDGHVDTAVLFSSDTITGVIMPVRAEYEKSNHNMPAAEKVMRLAKLLQEAIDDTPEFDADEVNVSAAEIVDFFGEFRTHAKSLLEEIL